MGVGYVLVFQTHTRFTIMITSAFLYVILGFVNWALGLLPLVSMDSNIANAILPASGYISSIGQVFPVLTLMAILAFVLAFDAVWILYQVIRWVYQKIPGIN